MIRGDLMGIEVQCPSPRQPDDTRTDGLWLLVEAVSGWWFALCSCYQEMDPLEDQGPYYE